MKHKSLIILKADWLLYFQSLHIGLLAKLFLKLKAVNSKAVAMGPNKGSLKIPYHSTNIEIKKLFQSYFSIAVKDHLVISNIASGHF